MDVLGSGGTSIMAAIPMRGDLQEVMLVLGGLTVGQWSPVARYNGSKVLK